MNQKSPECTIAMKNDRLDNKDIALMGYLCEDGRMPVKELAEKLELTPPTIYGRIRNLIASGILKLTGSVDMFKLGSYQAALIAINVNDDSKLASILDALQDFKEVQWAAAVTGRYDIFIEVLLEGSMETLFDFHSERLSRIDGISTSESFVIMKTKNKWFSLASFTKTDS